MRVSHLNIFVAGFGTMGMLTCALSGNAIGLVVDLLIVIANVACAVWGVNEERQND